MANPAGPLLIVTAVSAEADAVHAGLDGLADFVVSATGVGAAAAAAGTARQLARAEGSARPYRGVLCAGIAGGFVGRAPVGGVVLARRSIAADLGAESPDGFLPLDDLGFGSTVAGADTALLAELTAALPGSIEGDVLTVNTVTGTAATTTRLLGRFPAAVAEAMEGYGVARAAADAGVPFAELRAISNPIGVRDRGTWRIGAALAALTAAVAAVGAASRRPG